MTIYNKFSALDKNMCQILNKNKDASYQVSIHLAKRRGDKFLEINQSETRIACGGHVC